ncbi:hypothetical protein [Williamsia sp. 1135]|uniref:hypothetical protein n=1 Tax=Williamsia sp. 1135 TaxID=1889262 RepID=UPI000A11C537|nr:hypothetical protein [Williamsia sp. 1135]ORM38174.1 hypothetical protein BFL43_00910 [Williamsia sp. 1135]
MTEDRREKDVWWWSQTAELRDDLDNFARESVLEGLAGYPYWDIELCAELVAWSRLESEIAGAHSEWLERLKHRAESRGREWTRAEFLRMCRIAEAGE